MLRRDVFTGALTAAATLIGLRGARAETADKPAKSKVVYHLSDLDKASFVLGCIRNHYEGTKGEVEIALVVHGPALSAFRTAGAAGPVSSRFQSLVKNGLDAHACANTMHGMDIALPDLLGGFHSADAGGVVKIAELQQAGYLYLRP